VDDAAPLGELSIERVLAPAEALRHLPRLVVGEETARSVSHGLPLDKVTAGASGTGPWAVLDGAGRLLAVYRHGEGDRMVATCVLEPNG